jgi:hypothetical protein
MTTREDEHHAARVPIAGHVRLAIQPKDAVILNAVVAGAGRTRPCGVRVRRSVGSPTLIEVDRRFPRGRCA